MPEAQATKGITTNDMEQQGRKNLEQALAGAREQSAPEDEQGNEGQGQQQAQSQSQDAQKQGETQQKQETSQQQQQQEAQQSDSAEDAGGDNELAEYDSMLKSTFGFNDDNITDEARKLAKSYAEIQSSATKAQQEKKKYQKQLQNVDGLFKKDPSLFEHAQAVAEGKSFENPKQQQDSQSGTTSNQSKGQLNSEDGSVDEQTLISQGYVQESDLEGLDEVQRDKALARAEIRFEKDRTINEIKQSVQEDREQARKAREQQTIQSTNEDRLTNGLDNFVKETGFNLAGLDDDVFEEIQRKAMVDRDPDDPRLVADDAFEMAARRVLTRKGLMEQNTQQTQQQKKQQMQDTGNSFNQRQRGQQKKDLSMAEELAERSKKQFYNGNSDPKAQYFKNN